MNWICPLIVFTAAAILGGAAWFGWYFSDKRILQRALRGPASKIADLKPGLVRITGRVVSYEPVTTPITETECGCYRLLVQEPSLRWPWVSWTNVADEHGGRWLLLADGTGSVRVELTRVQLTIRPAGAFSKGPSEALRSWLARRRLSGEGWAKTLRHREDRVSTGDTVTAVGIARWQAPTEQSERGANRGEDRELVLRAPRDWKLFLQVEAPSAELQ